MNPPTRWRRNQARAETIRRSQYGADGGSVDCRVQWRAEIYVTTHGGPLQATTVMVYYLFNQAFELFHGGYAAAIAYVLFLAILNSRQTREFCTR